LNIIYDTFDEYLKDLKECENSKLNEEDITDLLNEEDIDVVIFRGYIHSCTELVDIFV
jgi:folate-dependent phosphoribosylglycinamide formyltransferase PurN